MAGDNNNTGRPFLLWHSIKLPPLVPPDCVYDPREQRCMLEHHGLASQTNPLQDSNHPSDYRPWTGDE